VSANSNQLKNLSRISLVIRFTLTLLTLLIIAFAVVSGSKDYGDGIQGIIKNSANALPWLAILIPVLISWKSEKIGGIVITIIGIALVLFFNTKANFFLSTFVVTMLIPLLGAYLWFIAKRKDKLRATEV
jgi:hypothetical protein